MSPTGTKVPGPWSNLGNFYYGDPTYGTVTPDDMPLGVLARTQALPSVLTAMPIPGASNISDYPPQVYAIVTGQVDLQNLTSAAFTLTGKAVDGNWQPNSYRPTFTPSLNGSQFGGGGVTIQGPADNFQQVKESGLLSSIIPTANFDGTNTTISLDVPTTFWQDNNWYNVKLDIPELSSPIEWGFTTRWSPVFTSAHSVRELTDFFIPELTEDDLFFTIRRNSLYAIWIQVYMPTKVDANFQIYQPPLSFNIDNPPFYVREYVRIKSGLDFMKSKYYQLIAAPTTILGDFTVNANSNALRTNVEFAIKEMKLELKEFEDALRGHSNRGYARGRASERGSYGSGKIDTFNFPYNVHNKKRGF